MILIQDSLRAPSTYALGNKKQRLSAQTLASIQRLLPLFSFLSAPFVHFHKHTHLDIFPSFLSSLPRVPPSLSFLSLSLPRLPLLSGSVFAAVHQETKDASSLYSYLRPNRLSLSSLPSCHAPNPATSPALRGGGMHEGREEAKEIPNSYYSPFLYSFLFSSSHFSTPFS